MASDGAIGDVELVTGQRCEANRSQEQFYGQILTHHLFYWTE